METFAAMIQFFKRYSVRTYCLVIVAVLALAGTAAAIYASASGPWGNQDSGSYIITARNFMRGIGLGYYLPDGRFIVWTIKPPLYSVILGAIGILGVNLVDVARWLNVLLFGATIFMAGSIFIRFSAAPWLSIPAAVFMAVFPTMLRMYSSSMSEPLFVFCLVASVYFLVGYFRHRSAYWLFFSALTIGLLPMIRYIGIAMIPVGALGVVWFLPSGWKGKIKNMLIVGIGSSLPILAWEAWVYFRVDRSLAGRTFQLDTGGMYGRFVQFYSAVTQYVLSWMPFGDSIWALRFRYRYALIFLVILLVVAITVWAARRIRKGADPAGAGSDFHVFAISGLWLVAYMIFLAADGLFLLPNPPITNRILLPFYAGLALAFIAALACWQVAWFRGKWGWVKIVPWAVTLAGLFWYLPSTFTDVMIPLHSDSASLTSYSWKSSGTMQAVRGLPKGTVIVSTDAYAVWVWADRPAYDLGESIQPDFIEHGDSYGADGSDLAQVAFRKKGSVLVVFSGDLDQILGSIYGGVYAGNAQARARSVVAGLTVIAKFPDGAIYAYP